MFQRLKDTYRRQWPPRPVSDPMSRNYRVKDRRPLWVLLVVLLAVLITSVVRALH